VLDKLVDIEILVDYRLKNQLAIEFTHDEIDWSDSNDQFRKMHSWNFSGYCKNICLASRRNRVTKYQVWDSQTRTHDHAFRRKKLNKCFGDYRL